MFFLKIIMNFFNYIFLTSSRTFPVLEIKEFFKYFFLANINNKIKNNVIMLGKVCSHKNKIFIVPKLMLYEFTLLLKLYILAISCICL